MPKLNQPNVVVFSKGKPDMTYTGEWFKQHGYSDAVYVLSPGDDEKEYRKSTGCRTVISDSFNLASKRQWATQTLTTERNPWLLFFEDNIRCVTRVSQTHYGKERIFPTKREWYHTDHISPQEVIRNMLEDIKLAEEVGAFYGGFACNDNHFFRKIKYRTVAFVWTKMAYVSRRGPCWPSKLNEMDDFGMTARCLAQSGRTLVNNFLYPWSKRYEGRGGSRTLEERAADKRRAVEIITSGFPDMFRVRDKVNCPTGTEIQLRFCSEKQIDKWRKKHDYV
jgi:hypothetical protein